MLTDHFEPSFDGRTVAMRKRRYPKQGRINPVKEGFLVGNHRDIGTIEVVRSIYRSRKRVVSATVLCFLFAPALTRYLHIRSAQDRIVNAFRNFDVRLGCLVAPLLIDIIVKARWSPLFPWRSRTCPSR